ncbi:MAG: CPBP family intramembrane metalloprotease [Chloroflexi bacterium]|nr:MAG: CPBP family intramembrane metalloprotease [Chloroflexota bacterium]TME58602.1 MAG: CPBP family intramembrane metalloprotease [Chloroflexota bacterium]
MRARGAAVVRNHPLLTPLFIVYGAINVLAVAFEAPLSHFPINLLLLAAYVVVIYVATRDRQVAAPTVQRAGTRSRDFGLAVTVAIVQLAAVIAVWFVIRPHGLPAAWASALRSAGVPHLIAAEAATALLGVGLLLVPTLVAVAAFRFRLRDVGLTANPRDLVLGVVLAAIAVGVGVAYVATGQHAGLFWESASLTVAAAAIALQSLVNGVPEELAFRGVIFGRLMPWLGRPGNSLAISTMVFGLFHVPMLIASGEPFGLAVGTGLFGALPGLLLGYAFYRTGSMWPGAIWHTSFSGVGLLFV